MRYLIVVLFIVSNVGCAQDSTFLKVIDLEYEEQAKMEFNGVYKSSISIEGGGKSGFAGLSYDLLLSKKWRVGVGVGYAGAGADMKFYPFGVARDKLIFNFGVRANALLPINGSNYMFYSAPIGLSFFTVNRLNLELDAGPMLKQPFDQSIPEFGVGNKFNYVWASIKIGYRFSFYAMKRAKNLDQLD